MRLLLALSLVLLSAAPAAAVEPGEAAVAPMAALTRRVWESQKNLVALETVQQVFSRTVGLQLPRGFVPAFRGQAQGRFIMEYVPDGETVQAWTRIITVTGSLGSGAARIDDQTLAATLFDRKACADWHYADTGPTKRAPLPYRTLVFGCGAEGAAGNEQGAIAFFRDDENSWTVQYAERGTTSKGFAGRVPATMAKLAPTLTCKAGEPGCKAPK